MGHRLSRLWTYLFVNTPRPGGVRRCLWTRFKGGTAEMAFCTLTLAPLLVVIALCIIAFRSGESVAGDRYQKQALEHGAAQYSPQTGAFEWKGDGNE